MRGYRDRQRSLEQLAQHLESWAHELSAWETAWRAPIRAWQLILPDFGTVEGPFQIVALEFAADHAG